MSFHICEAMALLQQSFEVFLEVTYMLWSWEALAACLPFTLAKSEKLGAECHKAHEDLELQVPCKRMKTVSICCTRL